MCDLFFTFALYFNKDVCLREFTNPGKQEEDKSFFEEIAARFGSCPEELYPFFYMKDKAKCFMTCRYFDEYEAQFTSSYKFETILSALSDYTAVEKALLRYYFDQISEQELDACTKSVQKASQLIRSSKYSDRLKCGLYSFVTDPAFTIQLLTSTLSERNILLDEYYAKHYQRIIDVQVQVDTTHLVNALQQLCYIKKGFCDESVLLYSLSMIAKNYVKVFDGHDIIILLGHSYNEILSVLISRKRNPDLNVFGTALSEPSRIDILDLIHRRGEVTIKDIEQELKIPGTTAYYHVSLMLKTGMLKTRAPKRTVYYSIDRAYFTMICEYLRKYIYVDTRR